MKTLLYIPRTDDSGPSPRYRVYQYIENFNKLGINVIVKPLFDARYLNDLYFKKKRSYGYLISAYLKRAFYLLFNKSKFDLVLMDGELFPFIPYFIEKFFLPRKFIIDQDDAIFHTYDKHKSWFVRKLFGKKIGKIWKKSQHIIVGNEYVEKIARSLGAKKVTPIPTVVDSTQYKPIFFDKNNKEQTIIGWVGSPATVILLSIVKTVLQTVARKRDIALYVIGANYILDGVNIYCTDWVNGWSEPKEIELTNQIDIGIMPLLDVPYQLGKCGFKLIKYMACAKPMIACSVGMNKQIIDHGQNGYLASSSEEWEKYLLDLIDNPNKRIEFGNRGREKMISQYSLQATTPIMNTIITNSYLASSS